MKKRSTGKRILRGVLLLLLFILVAAAGFLGWLTIREYRPSEVEKLAVMGNTDVVLPEGTQLKLMTWNLGYGCLGDNADFFMDGGKGVQTADEERLAANMEGIVKEITAENADLLFMQEVDAGSDRSYHLDEVTMIRGSRDDMAGVFALNFKADFVPYPIPPIGKVESGLLMLSAYQVREAQRISLPCPFSWPVRIANLKRCLEISRIPVGDGEKELVAVNVHLEAYDDGEGKLLQAAKLREVLESEAQKGNYVIVGGDYNQVFSGVDNSMYPQNENLWTTGILDEEEYEDGWQFLMDNTVPSCRSLDQPYAGADPDTFQYYLIDGFIVSSNVEVLSCETRDLGFVCSDHNPVLAEVRLKS